MSSNYFELLVYITLLNNKYGQMFHNIPKINIG